MIHGCRQPAKSSVALLLGVFMLTEGACNALCLCDVFKDLQPASRTDGFNAFNYLFFNEADFLIGFESSEGSN